MVVSSRLALSVFEAGSSHIPSQAELIIDARNGVESPVWHAVEQALYWTDIPARKLWRWTAATAVVQSWDTPEMLACMAPGPDAGSWIAGMETGVFVLKLQAGEKAVDQRVAIVAHARGGMRFNDGRCDRQGRFLAGTMLRDMAAGASIGCVYSYQKIADWFSFWMVSSPPTAWRLARMAGPCTCPTHTSRYN